ncbi:MAG: OB-fold nucleic acid binding domain-containing protein, partial [Nocardioidaceae bacterium]
NECRRMKIAVLPPDVNESDANFTPVGGDIRFGLSAIRNVGVNVVDGIVSARREQGRFADFADFLAKVPQVVCNKRVVESLVKAGAFDSLKHHRRSLVAIHEQAVDQAVEVKRNEAIGQDSLFAGLDDEVAGFGMTVAVPDIDEWDKATLLAHEREMIGLYVSDHPLLGLEHILSGHADVTIGQLLVDEDRPDGAHVTIAGLITSVQRKITKRGDPWAMVTVEDLEGAVDVLLFPSAYNLSSTLLQTDTVVAVKGRLSRSKDVPELHGLEVSAPDLTAGSDSGPVVISMPATRCTPPVITQLKEVLASHPGGTEVRLRLMSKDKTTTMRLPDQLRVTSAGPLYADLKALLGPHCLTGS